MQSSPKKSLCLNMEMKLILTEFEDPNFSGDAVSVVQNSRALAELWC